MIKYITLREHKGIKELCLTNLGHINAICGPNDTGKTAILEALDLNKKCSLGRIIDETALTELAESFASESHRYSTPVPGISQRWFSQTIQKHVGEIIYEHTVPAWVSKFHVHMAQDPHFQTYGKELFNFGNLFTSFLVTTRQGAKSYLLTANRELATTHPVTGLTSGPSSFGVRVLQSLYRLKSSGRGSAEYTAYQAIEKAFGEIARGYHFDAFLDQNGDIKMQFSRDGASWILAEDSGFGFRHLLTILHHVIASKELVILIEEPEIHLHPDLQRRLLQFLQDRKDKQFFISTHSNVFLDTTYVDKIFYTEVRSNAVTASDQTSKTDILVGLGYSAIDNLLADAIIITEGPRDIPILKALTDALQISKQYSLKYWPIGGDIMDQVDLSALSESKRVFAVVDRDPGSSKVRQRFEEACQKHEIPCHRLDRYSIENYLSPRAIRAVFPTATIPDALDNSRSVDEQLGFSIKKNGGRIAKLMSPEEWLNTDLSSFFTQIATRLNSASAKTSTLTTSNTPNEPSKDGA